jgi:Flp pilus assembly protein TadD
MSNNNKRLPLLVETLREGKRLLKEYKYEEALNVFDKAVKLSEENAILWATNGILQLKLEHYDRAEISFRNALQKDPLDPYFWAGLGYVLTIKNEYKNAKEAYSQALKKGIKIEELLYSHLKFVQDQLES